MLAQARLVRARAQGQQVALQQEASVRCAQAERGRPERQPEEERLARVSHISRVERRQRRRLHEDRHRERHQGKVHRAGTRMVKDARPLERFAYRSLNFVILLMQ